MKKLLLLLIIPLLSFGQDLTYVPDDGFELLIETVVPNASNGIENDNYVITSALNTLNSSGQFTFGFTISNEYAPIFDLTGIEDFVLRNLTITNTYINEIDLSNVVFVNSYYGNMPIMPSLTVENNQYIESVTLPPDTCNIYIAVTENLTSIDFNPSSVFNNVVITGQFEQGHILCELNVKGKLAAAYSWNGPPYPTPTITVSYIPTLKNLDFSGISDAPYQSWINITSQPIEQINLNNPISYYNWMITNGDYLELDCFELNSEAAVNFCSNDNDWPDLEVYSTNCYDETIGCVEINLEEKIRFKSLLKTIDILGRDANKKGFNIEIYDDGSVEKKYVIE